MQKFCYPTCCKEERVMPGHGNIHENGGRRKRGDVHPRTCRETTDGRQTPVGSFFRHPNVRPLTRHHHHLAGFHLQVDTPVDHTEHPEINPRRHAETETTSAESVRAAEYPWEKMKKIELSALPNSFWIVYGHTSFVLERSVHLNKLSVISDQFLIRGKSFSES